MCKQWAILSQVLCSVGNYAELDAVQRVDVGRLQGDSSTLWLKVYSSPITKVWVVTFDGDKSCCQQVATCAAENAAAQE